MTAPSPELATRTGRSGGARTARWIGAGIVVVAVVGFAVWAKERIDGLDTATQATNPIIRWEYVFERPTTPGFLWERTVEHLQLTVIPMALGIIIAVGLTLIARALRWTLPPITVLAGFLYTIPSFALFAILVTYTTNFVAAVIALTSYTLLVLVRSFVAGLDSVPPSVLDAADGIGMTPRRRLLTIELPLALPVIFTGIRVATVTTVGLVAVSSIIQLGGLGVLIFDGYQREYTTLITLGTVLSIALAVTLDLVLDRIGKVLTPWARIVR